MYKKSKRAQEEMVGFAFIIIVVAVILIIFISFTLVEPQQERVESFEVESFIQSVLQYTSNCSDNLERLPIQKLMFNCKNRERCLDERHTCDVLNETLEELLSESWKIENTPVVGYNLTILSEDRVMLSIAKGNNTNNFKGSTQKLPREIDVVFNAYY